MGLISETRTSLENPQTPLSFPSEWLLDIFNGGRTDSGIRVSQMSALQSTTVYACVQLISNGFAMLDAKIFERVTHGDGRVARRIAHEHDYFEMLEIEPNPEMSSYTFRNTLQAHALLWGNLFAEIQRDRSGKVIAIWPRNPARIKLHRAIDPIKTNTSDGIPLTIQPGQMVYLTTEGMETESIDPESPTPDPQGYRSQRAIAPEDMIHIPGLALDGRVGQDVIQLARNAVGVALATEKFGGKFFANGALGYGVFEMPGTLAPEDLAKWKQEYQESWGGENSQRPLILDGGVKYTPTSTKPNEGQFLETREFQVAEICRVFRVPPHMVADSGKQNRANTEQIALEFVTFTLRPWLKAWEQELKRKLFPTPNVGRHAGRYWGVLFDTRPIVMPAANDLRQFIQAMIQWGVMSQNDAREWLQLNPLDDPAADATWMQINMAPMDQIMANPALPSAEEAQNQGENDANDDDQEKTPAKKGKKKRADVLISRLSRSYSRLFRDAFGRISVRSEVDIPAFRRAFMPVLMTIGEDVEQFAAKQFGADASPDALENSKFLADYLQGMHERSRREQWASANGHSAEISDRELARAIRALTVEIYREVATRRAKQITEVHS
jgi:HK97 family phage portal protein